MILIFSAYYSLVGTSSTLCGDLFKLQSYINFHFLGLLSTMTSPRELRTMFTELVELGGLVQLGCHTPFSLSRTGNMQLTWLNFWRELINMCLLRCERWLCVVDLALVRIEAG